MEVLYNFYEFVLIFLKANSNLHGSHLHLNSALSLWSEVACYFLHNHLFDYLNVTYDASTPLFNLVVPLYFYSDLNLIPISPFQPYYYYACIFSMGFL